MLLVFQSGSAADVPYSVMTRIHTVATCLSYFLCEGQCRRMLIMDFSVDNIIHFAFTTVNIKTEELGAKNMRINLNKLSKKSTGNDRTHQFPVAKLLFSPSKRHVNINITSSASCKYESLQIQNPVSINHYSKYKSLQVKHPVNKRDALSARAVFRRSEGPVRESCRDLVARRPGHCLIEGVGLRDIREAAGVTRLR